MICKKILMNIHTQYKIHGSKNLVKVTVQLGKEQATALKMELQPGHFVHDTELFACISPGQLFGDIFY
jgi:hypothetical protein